MNGFSWHLLKNFVFVLLGLFVVPAITWFYAGHALTHGLEVSQNIDPAAALAQMEEACRQGHVICSSHGFVWQHVTARSLAGWTIAGGVILFALIALLAVLAFVNRGLQLISFTVGRHLMSLACVLTLVSQGTMIVWLSFWLTAFFSGKYFPKLILIAGVAVAAGIGYVLWEMFKKLPASDAIAGELVGKNNAPRLWQRIHQMAEQLQTSPPQYLIAGIDCNFFVTEAPLTVGDQPLAGRKLFVSLPLLRQLETREADAVLAHELAHFAGGDTKNSARLWPQLAQYDRYAGSLAEIGHVMHLVLPFLYFYRLIFEFALARESRAREFLADSAAARLVSPEAIARALVKIGAYSIYRAQVEEGLFALDEKLAENLGLAGRIREGLHPWAHSSGFANLMSRAHIPHPFDTHPPLEERMRNVSAVIAGKDFSQVVTEKVEHDWVEEIEAADAMETRLWAEYEQAFAQAHEIDLAYRYDPAKPEERDLVLKHFPPLTFATKKEGDFEINCETILPPGKPPIAYDDIKTLQVNDDVLHVTLSEKGLMLNKTLKVKLKGLGEKQEEFMDALGKYWARHQIMRTRQQEKAENTNG
ncbi:MAG: M48 family metalloprotease [Azoarcus sp.]|jgi:Zn-dependent protease with chaperone function|nr:M48 family metalloprotease [Azoarcus sp.]